jgi:hypothetical protein
MLLRFVIILLPVIFVPKILLSLASVLIYLFLRLFLFECILIKLRFNLFRILLLLALLFFFLKR